MNSMESTKSNLKNYSLYLTGMGYDELIINPVVEENEDGYHITHYSYGITPYYRLLEKLYKCNSKLPKEYKDLIPIGIEFVTIDTPKNKEIDFFNLKIKEMKILFIEEESLTVTREENRAIFDTFKYIDSDINKSNYSKTQQDILDQLDALSFSIVDETFAYGPKFRIRKDNIYHSGNPENFTIQLTRTFYQNFEKPPIVLGIHCTVTTSPTTGYNIELTDGILWNCVDMRPIDPTTFKELVKLKTGVVNLNNIYINTDILKILEVNQG